MNYSNWSIPQDNVVNESTGESYAWDLRHLILKAREYDRAHSEKDMDVSTAYTSFSQEHRDIFEYMFSRIDDRYIDIVDAVGDFRTNITVDNQYDSYAEDHPCRLTGEDIERDFLSGPNCMMDKGSNTHEKPVSASWYFWERRVNKFSSALKTIDEGKKSRLNKILWKCMHKRDSLGEKNWEHITRRSEERIELFLNISGRIIKTGNSDVSWKMSKIYRGYWKWLIEEGNNRPKGDPVLTGAQKAGIAWLFELYGKSSNAHKTPWSEVLDEISNKRIQKELDSEYAADATMGSVDDIADEDALYY